MSASDDLQRLHAKYCVLTGLEMKWQPMAMEHIWFDWWREGNTEQDLEITVKYLSRLYFKRPDILAACLRLKRLIGDTLFFSQMNAEARKIVRAKEENTAKASVLRATGRSAEEIKEAVPIAGILSSEAFLELVKLKETLK